jgi:hypothetical protein
LFLAGELYILAESLKLKICCTMAACCRRCEICGENAMNITGGGGGSGGKEFIRQWQDTAAVDGGGSFNACGGFCRSQSFCNLLIVLLIIACLLPWFFHNHMI